METAYQLLLDTLDELHRTTLEKAAAGPRSRTPNVRPGVNDSTFQKGDFVLVAVPLNKHTPKLRARWEGPRQIVDYVANSNNLVFKVKDLSSDTVQLVHAERLRWYADSSLHVSFEMRQLQAAHGDEFVVETFTALRRHAAEFQLKCKWLGFTAAESTWEPLEYMLSVYGDKVRSFLRRLPASNPHRQVLWQLYLNAG
jgi:hypothetical protein